MTVGKKTKFENLADVTCDGSLVQVVCAAELLEERLGVGEAGVAALGRRPLPAAADATTAAAAVAVLLVLGRRRSVPVQRDPPRGGRLKNIQQIWSVVSIKVKFTGFTSRGRAKLRVFP